MSDQNEKKQPISVFISYSHKDESFREELGTHLSILCRQGLISEWNDRKIMPGKKWEEEINAYIDKADLILLLISPDFIASDYCYGIELKKALDRHENNVSKVVPILIRPVDWQDEPISRIQALPKDATPVSTWSDRDEAWIDVAKGIRTAVSEINKTKYRSIQNHGLLSVSGRLKEDFKQLMKLYKDKSECGGLGTGFKLFDKCTDGIHPSDFVVIAARPMMGKTDFLVNVAAHIGIDLNVPVAFFSMKLPIEQITKKLICLKANINSHYFNKGWFEDSDWPRLTCAAGALHASRIYIDDSPTISIEELRTKVIKLQQDTGLGLIVIDSLHHLSNVQTETDLNKISVFTRSIKALARELKVPILASAQVARGVELKADKRPTLNDLDIWHSLVEDADVVSLLYYDQIYNNYTERHNIAELILGKNRHGPTGTVEFKYDNAFNLFSEISNNDNEA